MKYRLLGPHVLSGGERLETGTEVGDETGYPWKYADGKDMDPTPQMEGLDEPSRAKVREVWQRLYGTSPSWEGQSEEVAKAREKEAEDQKKLDEGSEPVSAQQKAERAKEDRDKAEPRLGTMPGPRPQPSHTVTASPTRPGSSTPAPAPATVQPPKADEVRPKKPNEEQYPKG